MSQIGQATPSNLSEGSSVTSLTLLVLLLIPCVVLLLLLNCLFLGYKLLIISKRRKRDHSEEMLLQSTLSTRHRVTRVSDAPFTPNDNMKTNYVCMSEPIMHPVTSSRTSSRERVEVDQRIRFLRPDGATGSEGLIAPSTILATSTTTGSTCRTDLPRRLRLYSKRKPGWFRSAPVLPQSSDSEVDTRPNLVPPNSPAVLEPLSRVAPDVGHLRRSSTLELLKEVNHENSPEHLFDEVDFVCEYISSIPAEASYLNSSAVGPGLDSDFGASAGVSLRILSADSDGLSNGVLSSALEWDYYDPCYVRQNNIPKHKHRRPAMHSKQYWV